MKPFQNEEDSIQIVDLTIENRLDRVSLYGNLDITLDKAGLKSANQLKDLLDKIITEMGKRELPDQIEIAAPETVKNPFA